MAKKIIWSEDARTDVRAIDRITALSLLEGLARFAFTESGAMIRRSLRLGDYRLRFRNLGDSIEILRVTIGSKRIAKTTQEKEI